MLLVVVPFAHPHDVLRCRRNLTDGAQFGAGAILEPDGRLVPSANVCGLGLAEAFGGLRCRGPVNAADECLAVASAGEPMLALLFGLCL